MDAQQNFNRVATVCIRYLLSVDENQIEEAIEEDPDLTDELREELREFNRQDTRVMMEDLDKAYEATLRE